MEKTNLMKLSKLYKEFAILKIIRENTGQNFDKFASKFYISQELYICFERDEIEFETLPIRTQAKIENLINTYYQTFLLNRQDAFKMWELSTGMTREFFIQKFAISERTFFSYLAGENILRAKEIDDYLLIN